MERRLRQLLPTGKFVNVPVATARTMSAVRGAGNRTTERLLRLALVRAGIRKWQVRPKGIKGSPDFLFPSSKLAVFVDGCFWHGCPECGHIPTKHRSFWEAKIQSNRERDLRASSELTSAGYRVVRLWEHELADGIAGCILRLRNCLEH